MDLKSMDVGADNRAKLKQLFPSVFTETTNKSGELVESINFDKLKAELGKFSDTYEKRRKRYGMDWPGKKDCMKLIQKPSVATLKPCREESVNFDNTENLFVEGDNLEVLKLLQKSYYGKIKMIHIDPPYNTGNEFIYPDDYSESLETYRRAERLPWARPMKESSERVEIKVFDYDHGVKDIRVRRYIWLAEYDYVLILQQKKKALFWVTAYYVGSERGRKDLARRYEKRLQKTATAF